MYPVSLCLVTMSRNGLEIVKSFPDVILPKDLISEIIIKSMPLGAKNGDFTTNVLRNEYAISSFVFRVPSQKGRDDIASLVALFDNTDYDSNIIRKIFSITIDELKKNNVLSLDHIVKILPLLYHGIHKKHISIKISSDLTVDIDISKLDAIRSKSEKDKAKTIADEFW